MIKNIFLVSFLLISVNATCLANFDFNSNCVEAYKSIVALRLAEGHRLIEKEKAIHPQNGITVLLDNYYDFFLLLTTDSKAEFDKLKDNKSKRIDLLSKNDENSPYYNYSIAQVNLQWALLNSRFAEYTAAGLEVNRAYKLLQDNVKKYPSFLPDNMPLGVVNVLLGSLPDGALKSVLNFFGITGDTRVGARLMENLVIELPKSVYSYNYDELIYYLTYIQTDVLNDPLAYSKMMQYTTLSDKNSLLRTYITAYVSLRTGHSTEAINLLQNRVPGAGFQSYPVLEYLLAIAKMNRLDVDGGSAFNKFLSTSRGADFIKDSYLHLAWQALLQGDAAHYQYYINLTKTKGSLFNDKDKQAYDEANDAPPNVVLLKARLLFDGGYYTKAIAVLNGATEASFNQQRDKIEFLYRLGRINDAMHNDAEAIKYYEQAINAGRNSVYHYAATSSIKLGNIYEQRKDLKNARECYRAVFNFKNTQFKNSLQQKAKEALKRVG
jgi:hypothetical protein